MPTPAEKGLTIEARLDAQTQAILELRDRLDKAAKALMSLAETIAISHDAHAEQDRMLTALHDRFTAAPAQKVAARPADGGSPFFNTDGDACCPWHPTSLLKESKYGGLYCGQKGGPQPSPKGYCSYQWKGAV